MKPNTLRVLGIIFALAAVTTSVLNLKRMGNLGMPWLGPLLLVTGAILVIRSKRLRARE